MPKRKGLSFEDKKFIQAKVEGKSNTEAYQIAHPECTYNTARKMGSEVVTKPHIQAVMDSYLKKHGGGADKAAQALGRGLTAERVVVTNIKTGDYIKTPDNMAQLKAVETTFKAVGILRQEDNRPSVSINLPPIDSKIMDRLERLERKAQAEDAMFHVKQ